MNKKIAVVLVSLVMVFNFIVILDITTDFASPVGGTTYYVNETGFGAFDKIQDAINASSDGDTVFVYNGTYNENVVVNKSINLTGEDRDATIINGSENGDVVRITIDWVNVSNFTVIESGYNTDDAGIKLDHVLNCKIINNNVSSNNRHGIYIYYSDKNNITGNSISRNDYGIRLYSSSKNMITGNNISIHGWNGIDLAFSSNNTITDNNVSDNPESCIYLDSSSNNNITYNDFSMGKFGIYLSTSSNCNIANNKVFSNFFFGILLESSSENNITENNVTDNNLGISLSWSSSNNNITGNNASLNDGNGISLSWSSNNNTITVNTVLGNGDPLGGNGIDISSSSSNNTIAGNTVYNSSEYGISLDLSHGNNIRGNKAVDNWQGIYLESSDGNNITSNNASNNKYSGIYITDSSKNIISSNNIYLNNMYGISLHLTSSENNITSNNVSNNKYEGIFLEESSKNNITGNNISNNSQGIFISSSSRNNITYNNISENRNSGILVAFSSSHNNTITNNNVYLNKGHGIYLEWASNNRIYHNNIMGNTNQAYDSEDNNFWNDTYPSGGNYWSDLFPVADKYSGPLQNILGSDGINDSAYIIDSDSQDNYPLVNPNGNYIFLYEGWNLISIPFIQTDQDLGEVLISIGGSYDTVWRYNVGDNIDHWKVNSTLKAPLGNDMDNIDHKMGFWINITKPGGVLFEYYGIQPSENQTISLYPGWNLVGYPSLTFYNRTDGLNNLTFGSHVNSIWTYDASTPEWKELGELDYFETGRGYWIHAKGKCEWEVPL